MYFSLSRCSLAVCPTEFAVRPDRPDPLVARRRIFTRRSIDVLRGSGTRASRKVQDEREVFFSYRGVFAILATVLLFESG